ncbi:MAG TPA: AzlD domain-containing protein [Clostridium sp.]|jgi:branched-subunit amino acid transport protein|nr:AzlD domain-containing protein [Clostridia bacterium]HCW05629.1 AzlD domain-containing protein [Clostridium sp.]
MKDSYIILLLGMMLVTYLPRLIPFFLARNSNKQGWLKRFLKFIPCTALGALIIPGAFDAIPEMPMAGIAGLSFAFVYSFFRKNVIVAVLGAVLVSYLMLLIG